MPAKAFCRPRSRLLQIGITCRVVALDRRAPSCRHGPQIKMPWHTVTHHAPTTWSVCKYKNMLCNTRCHICRTHSTVRNKLNVLHADSQAHVLDFSGIHFQEHTFFIRLRPWRDEHAFDVSVCDLSSRPIPQSELSATLSSLQSYVSSCCICMPPCCTHVLA